MKVFLPDRRIIVLKCSAPGHKPGALCVTS